MYCVFLKCYDVHVHQPCKESQNDFTVADGRKVEMKRGGMPEKATFVDFVLSENVKWELSRSLCSCS